MDQPSRSKNKKRKLTEKEIKEECEVLSDISVNTSDDDFDFSCSDSDSDTDLHIESDDSLNPDEVSILWEDCDILFEPQVQQFKPEASGISYSFPVTVESLELKYFQAYLNEEVVNTVADETNKYYQFCVNKDGTECN